MKKVAQLLFSVLIVIFLLQACSRTDVQYWENGNIKSEIKYKNGKIHGLAIWYYEEGKKYYEANYVDEKLEGSLTKWYLNGLIQSREHYANDMLNGKSVFFNIRGRKTEEVTFVNDTMQGDYRAWYEDRKMRMEGQYKDGMMTGKWFYWDQMGNLIGEGNFVDGSGVQKKYNPNGSLQGRLSFKNNEKHGKELYYNADGEVIKEVIYDSGEFIKETILNPMKK